MREKELRREPASGQLETILERVLMAYQRDELHGGASWLGERILDAELVPIAREAFRGADNLPADHEVLRVLDGEPLQLLGEGYHVIALVEPGRRFVVKYAKYPNPVPPLAPAVPELRAEWQHDHGVRPDGSLHPAIWQHIRAFETYGPLAVPSRVYLADAAFDSLAADERRSLERFRSMGIVRSLGSAPRPLRVNYPDDFPHEKRAPERLSVAVVVVQPLVTPLATAIEEHLRAGDVAAARDLKARYDEFTEQLWRCGVSHLDFSLLNIAMVGTGQAGRLQIFDPHIGIIDVADGAGEVRDPLWTDATKRSVEKILRSSRDGSRWALWRVQQEVTASQDVPREGAEAATALVHEFHDASEGLEQGEGSFGFDRFDRTWQQRHTHVINAVMHAELWALVTHPIGGLLHSVLAAATPGAVYDRRIPVLEMGGDRPLPQFRAGLKVYDDRPLILIANVADDRSSLVKHWGRVPLPEELDVQDDEAIHYHLRDLFTGELYVRPGADLAARGLVVGLAPRELHVLQMEDVSVSDMAVERTLAAHRDIREFLPDCTKRVGVVGDVHGELQALKDILAALGFIDRRDRWSARDGTLVFTGDIGHGRHLQEVFDFIRRIAAEAHSLGGRIVWTLGNHDLYVDREGGQGGEDSLGYRLWPTIREAALNPERYPGLTVQAAYFEHGKLFVHAGVLPNIVELAARERGASDPETVASYVNDVLRRTLVERERIRARDLPHEIFCVGTSHARERRLPGEIGYEPAGVFTPDLRELDHYRYHAQLLPQVVGHTASRRGEIRYSPGSWLRRDYIAIDVGRQHGTGNGGLLLTAFGWVAVVPGGPARLVEVTPLFAELAREAPSEGWREEQGGETQVRQMLSTYFQVAKAERQAPREAQEHLFAELSPAQVVSLQRSLAMVRQSGRCAIVIGMDDMLTAFSGAALEEDTIHVFADYLHAGGVLVFTAETAFEWVYARLLRSLVVELGPRSPLLARMLCLVAGGRDIFAFEDGAFRQIPIAGTHDSAGSFEALMELSKQRPLQNMPVVDRESTLYLAGFTAPGRVDAEMARRAGFVVDLGDAIPSDAGGPISGLQRGYRRTRDVIAEATAALRESARAELPSSPPEISDTALWTFERPDFPTGRRIRIHVRGSGFVHAGIAGPTGAWAPAYNVPLVPVPAGGHEAVLPSGVNAFTFFWTEPPWTPRQPGHWEQAPRGGRVFRASSDDA